MWTSDMWIGDRFYSTNGDITNGFYWSSILNFTLFILTSYYLNNLIKKIEFENYYIEEDGMTKEDHFVYFSFQILWFYNLWIHFIFWNFELYIKLWVFLEYTCCYNLNMFFNVRICINLGWNYQKNPINNHFSPFGEYKIWRVMKAWKQMGVKL
jgi:hypothetical protein